MADVLVIVGAGLLCYSLREDFHDISSSYLVALVLAALFGINLMQFAGVYRAEFLRTPIRELARTAGAWVATLFILVALAALTKPEPRYDRERPVTLAGFKTVLRFAALLPAGRQA